MQVELLELEMLAGSSWGEAVRVPQVAFGPSVTPHVTEHCAAHRGAAVLDRLCSPGVSEPRSQGNSEGRMRSFLWTQITTVTCTPAALEHSLHHFSSC